MRIQNNIMAMNTHRQLGVNNLNQTKSTEKLSSGYRINRAADDASGLSISEKMRAQIRGLNQASANAQDGISLVQAAEGALQETHSILQRMRELAVKAANDVNETEDRAAIAQELNQLSSEVDRIAYTTEFNKKTLLDGSLNNGVKYGKVTSGDNLSSVNVLDQTAASKVYSVAVTTVGSKLCNEITLTGTPTAGSFVIKQSGGVSITVATTVGDSLAALAAKAAELLNNNKTFSADYEALAVDGKLTITAKDVGNKTNAFELTTGGGVSGTAGATGVGAYAKVSVDGGAEAALTSADGKLTLETGKAEVYVADQLKLSSATVEVNTGRDLTLQVGANTGSTQTISVAIESLSASALGISKLAVSDHSLAQASISNVEKAIQKVSTQRSALGAVQNRLEHTVANLDTVSENLQSAESRIRDVDMAKEMMNFTKNNILTQAATAMLAQANQAPQTVLQLLQ
jgi:flagellin